MFGWVDFGEDGNRIVENKKENKWEGEGKEKMVELGYFLSGPPKLNFPKIGR